MAHMPPIRHGLVVLEPPPVPCSGMSRTVMSPEAEPVAAWSAGTWAVGAEEVGRARPDMMLKSDDMRCGPERGVL